MHVLTLTHRSKEYTLKVKTIDLLPDELKNIAYDGRDIIVCNRWGEEIATVNTSFVRLHSRIKQ